MRGQPAGQGLQPGSSCMRRRRQVRGCEPRGAERRGERRGAATRHTHSSEFPMEGWGLCVDNSILVGFSVRPRPGLGGLAVSLSPALGTHPHPVSQVARAPVVISVYRRARSKLGSISALASCSAEPRLPESAEKIHLRPFPTPNARRGRVRKRGFGKDEPLAWGILLPPIPGPHPHPGLLSLGLVPAPMLRATCPPWASSPRLDLWDVSSLAEAQAWRLHSQVFPHPSRR